MWFIRGFLQTFDLFGVIPCGGFIRDDAEALRSDWETVIRW